MKNFGEVKLKFSVAHLVSHFFSASLLGDTVEVFGHSFAKLTLSNTEDYGCFRMQGWVTCLLISHPSCSFI